LEQKFPGEEFQASAKQVALVKETVTLLLPRRHAEEQGYYIDPAMEPCQVQQSRSVICSIAQ